MDRNSMIVTVSSIASALIIAITTSIMGWFQVVANAKITERTIKFNQLFKQCDAMTQAVNNQMENEEILQIYVRKIRRHDEYKEPLSNVDFEDAIRICDKIEDGINRLATFMTSKEFLMFREEKEEFDKDKGKDLAKYSKATLRSSTAAINHVIGKVNACNVEGFSVIFEIYNHH